MHIPATCEILRVTIAGWGVLLPDKEKAGTKTVDEERKCVGVAMPWGGKGYLRFVRRNLAHQDSKGRYW